MPGFWACSDRPCKDIRAALPPTTALERDQYDLVFHAFAVRNTARFTPAVLPKPAGMLHD